jgi:hypothetical protein
MTISGKIDSSFISLLRKQQSRDKEKFLKDTVDAMFESFNTICNIYNLTNCRLSVNDIFKFNKLQRNYYMLSGSYDEEVKNEVLMKIIKLYDNNHKEFDNPGNSERDNFQIYKREMEISRFYSFVFKINDFNESATSTGIYNRTRLKVLSTY